MFLLFYFKFSTRRHHLCIIKNKQTLLLKHGLESHLTSSKITHDKGRRGEGDNIWRSWTSMRNKIQRQRPCFITCTPSICIQGELEEPGNGINTWFISSIGQSRNPGIILCYTFLHGFSQNRIWQFKITRVPHRQSILLLQKCHSQVYLQYRIIFVIKRITWYNFV